MSVDTLETVCVKFNENFGDFFDTLIWVADDLSSKGYNVPNSILLQSAVVILKESFTPEDLLIGFAGCHEAWPKIDSRDLSYLEENAVSFFGDKAPQALKDLCSKLFKCKTKVATSSLSETQRARLTSEELLSESVEVSAIDEEVVDIIFDYLVSFVNLSVKCILFKREPHEITYHPQEGYPIYVCKKPEICPQIDVSKLIFQRKISNVPTSF